MGGANPEDNTDGFCLNPYSNGSTTMGILIALLIICALIRLNPYSNGSTTMGLI